MGHYCNIYGYLLVHSTKREEVENYLLECRDQKIIYSTMVFGPYKNQRSGFSTFAIGGEIKEYYQDDPDEMINQFKKFLDPINGIYCVLSFDSETQIYPSELRFVKHESVWNKEQEISINEGA